MIRLSRACEYAMIIMIELAGKQDRERFYPLKTLISEHPLPIAYVDRIARSLTQDGLLEALHGYGGGYRLTKDPEDYNVLEIIMSIDSPPSEDAFDDETLSPFMGIWSSAKDSFFNKLSNTSLAKLASAV